MLSSENPHLVAARRAAEAGKNDDVIAACHLVLEEIPLNSEANFLKGSALMKAARFQEALLCFDKAWRSSPQVPFALMLNSGICLLQERRFSEALNVLKQAQALRPDSIEVAEFLVMVYGELELPECALEIVSALLDYDPVNSRYWLLSSSLNNSLGFWVEAAKAAMRAAAFSRDPVVAKIQLIQVLANAGMYSPAQRLALSVPDDDRDAWSVRGTLSQKLGCYENAIVEYQRALDCPSAITQNEAVSTGRILFNLALAHLVIGDYQRGWELYARRFEGRSQSNAMPLAGLPFWQGEVDHNSVVFVHSEQGLGDVIQCLRYLPLLRERVGLAVWNCYPSLIGLLSCDKNAEEVASMEVAPTHQVFMFDLPRLFEAKDGRILPTMPYINAPEGRLNAWRERMRLLPGFKVGLIWAGNPRHQNDPFRSMALQDFESLASIPGVRWFGLQVGEFSLQAQSPPPGMELIDLSPEIHDFGDTAAILGGLDLLLTIDSSVAHLAGAMGCPVWMLLPHRCDWRWEINRNDSPWYPSMHLFRQAEGEFWPDVMARVRVELARLQLPATLSKVECLALDWLCEFDSTNQDLTWSELWQMNEGAPAIFNLLFAMPAELRLECLRKCKAEKVTPWQRVLVAEARQDVPAAIAAWETIEKTDVVSWSSATVHLVRLLCRQKQFDPVAKLLMHFSMNVDLNIGLKYWKGQFLRQQEKFDEAIVEFSAVLAVSPRAAEPRVNLAVCYRAIGHLHAAIRELQKAVLYNPRHVPSWEHLLRYLEEAKDWQSMALVAEQMLDWAPVHVMALYFRGVSEQRLGNWQVAEEALRKVLDVDPNHIEAAIWLARAHFAMGRHEMADRMLSDLPQTANVRLARGINSLALGEYKEGWDFFEARLEFLSAQSILRDFPSLEKWNGINQGPVFVRAEHGYGDTMMLARYLPLLPDGSLVQIQDGLECLIARSFPQHRVISTTASLSMLDIPKYGIDFMSLPTVLHSPKGKVFFDGPYLITDPSRSEALRARLASVRKFPFSVGLVWAGNAAHSDDLLRSISILKLESLFRTVSADWFSLQKGEAGLQLELLTSSVLFDADDWINDWEDTAALVQQLDVIVTVDTAVVHLAGALGKQAVLLLHEPAEWRWGIDGDASRWYPSVRLIRQKHCGEWGEVISLLTEMLTRFTSCGVIR